MLLARPTWVEVDLDCIAHNIAQFRALAGAAVEIMAVVKADGYGHGAVAVGQAAVEAGASRLAVASFEEGVELRRAGLQVPILILGYTDPGFAGGLAEHQLTPSVSNLETARALSRNLAERGGPLPFHIKVDTGMSRLGVPAGEALDLLAAAAVLPGMKLEGLFTHLAAADDEDPSFTAYTGKQLQLFAGIVEASRARGISIPLRHAANSAAAVRYPEPACNAIRLGISMYGHYPASWMAGKAPELRPALSLKSRIVHLRDVPPGTAVSYGCTYVTPAAARIATVPVGYGDGYRRDLSNRGHALAGARRVPVVGRVCMDHLMLDVTGLENIASGDEVVLYGRQGEEEISVDEVAGRLGTISYELLCALDKRVPRFYRRDEHVVAGRDLLGYKNL